MSVRKYRGVDEMPPPPPISPHDPRRWQRLAALWALADRLGAPRRFPPGVHRFASVEAAARRRSP